MTVDSNARRQAILFEIVACGMRYECDEAPRTQVERVSDVRAELDHLEIVAAITGERLLPPLELAWMEVAGRAVAALEHLEAEKAKA